MSEYTQSTLLSLAYNVWICGTMLGLDKKACIKSIDIEETTEGADSAKLVISDPHFLYIEDNIFVEDATIKIMMGWDNTTYRVTFNGFISAIDINFAADGIPVLTCTCMDNTHKMNREKKNETFTNCTSADVVKKKCAEYGFTCVIEDGYEFPIQETITQSDQSDIDFITKLAGEEVHPFTARLVGNTFYYVKKGKLNTPVMELTYKKYPHEIISFSPKINKETRQSKVESSSLTTSDKSVSTTSLDGDKGTGGASENGNPTSDNTNAYGGSSGSHTYNPQTQSWS